jgi:hypothetical protein
MADRDLALGGSSPRLGASAVDDRALALVSTARASDRGHHAARVRKRARTRKHKRSNNVSASRSVDKGRCDPEDGRLWVYGVGEEGVAAFTEYCIECLRQIIADEREAGNAPPKVTPK